MERDEIIATLQRQQDTLKHLSVKSLALFGSFARGEGSAEGDIDILVEFEGKASLGRYMDLKFLLEDLLGRPIDLVTSQALRPQLRPRIEEEAIRVT